MEMGVGIRVLHSHNLYHHNLKLENIFKPFSPQQARSLFATNPASTNSHHLLFF
jgi:hypothetical protein